MHWWTFSDHSLPFFISFYVSWRFVDIIEGKDEKVSSDKATLLDKDRCWSSAEYLNDSLVHFTYFKKFSLFIIAFIGFLAFPNTLFSRKDQLSCYSSCSILQFIISTDLQWQGEHSVSYPMCYWSGKKIISLNLVFMDLFCNVPFKLYGGILKHL